MHTLINFVHRVGLIKLFLLFFFAINLFTFLLYFSDKRRAINNKFRIKESTLILFTLAFGAIGALFGMFFLRHKTKKFKFKLALVNGLIIALIPIIHVIHSLTLDRIIVYQEITFVSENWPAQLDGYRIAFMTDFHSISDIDMANTINELNERSIDLLLLGGDFSSDVFWGGNHFEGTIREISNANTTDGIFGVDGNHDVYYRLFDVKARYGIGILDNSGLNIRPGFHLAGVQDYWSRNSNITSAINEAVDDDFVILITHNPDVVMSQSTVGVDLIFAGHTHGGQITLFGWPFYLYFGSISAYQRRFAHGFNTSRDEIPIFTSRGIGPYYNWPRIFARPEVIIFTMYNY